MQHEKTGTLGMKAGGGKEGLLYRACQHVSPALLPHVVPHIKQKAYNKTALLIIHSLHVAPTKQLHVNNMMYKFSATLISLPIQASLVCMMRSEA